MKRARLLVLSSIATAMGLSACASVFGFDDLTSDKYDGGHDGSVATKDSATNDGTTTDSGTPDTGCGSVGDPDPPPTETAADGGDTGFIVAFDNMDLGIAPDGGSAIPVGFNLDRFCTVDTTANSCIATGSGTDYTAYVLDKTAVGPGVDNAGFNLIGNVLSVSDTFSPASINDRLQRGEFGALVKVTGYNGGANDKSVSVFFFPAVGLLGANGSIVSFSPTDLWEADTASIIPAEPGFSIYSDNLAYVTNGVLVAHLSSVFMQVSVSDPDPRMSLSLADAVVTANIVPATGSSSAFRLTNGRLGGRWATRTFLSAIAPLSLLNNPVCSGPNSGTFSFIKQNVCDGRDITARGVDDNKGETCDAMSVGMAFDTYAVNTFTTGNEPITTDAGCPDVGDCL